MGEAKMLYELAIILDAELDDDKVQDELRKIREWIESKGGHIEGVEEWGRRELAYPIKKREQGYYAFVYFEVPPQISLELREHLRMAPSILRFRVFKTEKLSREAHAV